MKRLTLYDIAYLIGGAAALPWVVARKGRMPDGWRIRWGRYPAETLAAPELSSAPSELRSSEEERAVSLPRPATAAALERCRGGIWLHAVSLGEAKAAAPLVQALHERYPDLPLLLTAVTRTGYETLVTLGGAHDAVTYVPLDLSWLLDRFVAQARPRLLVLLEKELWPGLLAAVARHGVPVVVVNGRLSERSAARYRRVGWIARRLLGRLDRLLVQSEVDRERLVALGAPPERTTVTGNLKYDHPPVCDASRCVAQARRRALGLSPQEIVWIGGSTHRGEEATLISAYRALRVRGVPLRLLLAPRHVERVLEVERLVRAAGLTPVRLSALAEQDTGHKTQDIGLQSQVTSHKSQVSGQRSNVEGQRAYLKGSGLTVWILDTSGELSQWYGVADIAFVGGSLIPHGGQNLLEPAAWALPIVTGPHTANFAAVAEALAARQAFRVVENERALTETVERWARSPQGRQEVGRRAEAVGRAAAGATARVMAELADYLTRDTRLETRDSGRGTPDLRQETRDGGQKAEGRRQEAGGGYSGCDSSASGLVSHVSSLKSPSVVERWQRRLAPALIPLSWLYGAGVGLVRGMHRRGLLPRHRLSRPVISVGNLTWGGTGKTPLVAWVAQALRRDGRRVVVLSRGYRSRSSVGADEVRMLGAQLPEVPVVAGRDRVRRGREAIARHDPDVVLLDDGFQHWRLARDLDIVTVDARALFGNGRLIPAGSLRESPAALGRADLIVVTKSDSLGAAKRSALREQLRRWNAQAPIVMARYRVVDLIRLSDGTSVDAPIGYESWAASHELRATSVGQGASRATARGSDFPARSSKLEARSLGRNGPVALVAAIADPVSFEQTVAGLGFDVAWCRFFGDHHPYRRQDLETVAAQCRCCGIERVLTTEKDAVKLRRWEPLLAAPEWDAVRVALEVDDEDGTLAARLAACGHRPRG